MVCSGRAGRGAQTRSVSRRWIQRMEEVLWCSPDWRMQCSAVAHFTGNGTGEDCKGRACLGCLGRSVRGVLLQTASEVGSRGPSEGSRDVREKQTAPRNCVYAEVNCTAQHQVRATAMRRRGKRATGERRELVVLQPNSRPTPLLSHRNGACHTGRSTSG
jgi:hypothetical protein